MTLLRLHYIILGDFGLGGDSLVRSSADVFGNRLPTILYHSEEEYCSMGIVCC